MSIARHHAEWLSLTPVSGPFLSMPVLLQAFPQGLEAHDPEHFRLLRQAYEEWDAQTESGRPAPETRAAWVRFVLEQTLGLNPEHLAEGQAIPQSLQVEVPEHGELLRPTYVLLDPADQKPRLLIKTYQRSQDLASYVAGSRWKASPDTRMTELLHGTGVRLGLVTNGEHWMLVDAPKGETAGYASWYGSLWLDEKITLQAFRSLLSSQRFFGVAADETIDALLAKSAGDQQEVTDQLGKQVLQAVEVLIQSLDRADQDNQRALLEGVPETVLYESALTVMMRLVFLFCAEERELIPTKPFPVYDQNYSVSTISKQLRDVADQHGEELLERRFDGWPRLLAAFRAVYGGLRHDEVYLPAYGGRLFDPDRFPFLEGRPADSRWLDTSASPLPVNNRTVLHLLEALQLLEVKTPGRGKPEARRLSFRALDIEQIGHVYEGLLDHTAKRANEVYLGLTGKKEPELALSKLETERAKGAEKFAEFLKKLTGGARKWENCLDQPLDDRQQRMLRTACANDDALAARVAPFFKLLREDTLGYPVIVTPGSVFVTSGTDRRSSGTHYTPRSLTEPIVQHTLEPLVYVGPAEGEEKKDWQLKSAREILDLNVCDMACGSGAFLVQAARYLSERLMEAWDAAAEANPDAPGVTPLGEPAAGVLTELLIPADPTERRVYALRLVAQRCLYGVDINPLAVEMAKLSMWLLTLAKDKPFEFLDHAIRCGDSLVGIHSLEQLKKFSLKPEDIDEPAFSGDWLDGVEEAVQLRLRLEGMQSNLLEEVREQEQLLATADERISRLRYAADLLVSAQCWAEGTKDALERTRHFAVVAGQYVEGGSITEFEQVARKESRGLRILHWPIAFPEVYAAKAGFDAILGNPPFYAGAWLKPLLGESCRKLIVDQVAEGRTGLRGTADYCVYFHLRSIQLSHPSAHLGLVLSSAAVEGDSRAVGFDHILSRQSIYYTAPRPWPGTASVSYVCTWTNNCPTGSLRFSFPVIALQVRAEDEAYAQEPKQLECNAARICKGHELQGNGFKITENEFLAFLDENPQNAEVLAPFITGDSLNDSPTLSPDGYVINFGKRNLEEASQFQGPFRTVEERVKPERMRYTGNAGRDRFLRTYWWQFRGLRSDLHDWAVSHKRILACTVHTKYLNIAFLPSHVVPTPSIYCFLFDDDLHFGILQSAVHDIWANSYTSSLGETLRYISGRCFKTFPFPSPLANGLDAAATSAANQFYSCRSQLMNDENIGMTDLYNQFHDSSCNSQSISSLREDYMRLNWSILRLYGWDDLDAHDFVETQRGVRFSLASDARHETRTRLLKLNSQRRLEEVDQGRLRTEEKAQLSRKKVASKKLKQDAPALFDKGRPE